MKIKDTIYNLIHTTLIQLPSKNPYKSTSKVFQNHS